MVLRITLLLLTACLLTGCGKAENTEISVDIFNKESCIRFDETELEMKEEDFGVEIDYTNIVEAKDISNVNISNIEKIPFNKDTEYKKGKTPEQIRNNTKQKMFSGECEKVEHIISERVAFHKKDAIFEARYEDTVVYNDNEGIYDNIDELIEDKENDTSIYKCKLGLYDIKEDMSYTCSVLSNVAWDTEYGMRYCVNKKAVALFENVGFKNRICVIDMVEKEYRIIDFGNMIRNEYGICEENRKYNDGMSTFLDDRVFQHEFVDDNKLALATYSNHLFVYDINKEMITECIDFNADNIKDISIRIEEGVANILRKYQNDMAEYYAIDLNSMEVVSYIDFGESRINRGYYKCVYKNGVTYIVMADGLYVYNPDTKKCDAVYFQMEENSKYTFEQVVNLNMGKNETDETYLYIDTDITFDGKIIYLKRIVWCEEEGHLEEICKKLTIK